MKKRESLGVPKLDEDRRWKIPAFLIRNYQYGYERECTDYLFGGDNKRGAREELEERTSLVYEFGAFTLLKAS